MNYSKQVVSTLCAAVAASTLLAQEAAPAAAPAEEEESEIGVSVSADYSTVQITRGVLDNKEGILTLAGAVEAYGFTAEIDALFNTTDIFKEDGFDEWDNTEIDYVLGYGYTVETDFSAIELGVDYTFEFDQGGVGENDHVQYIHASIALADLWLAPSIEAEWMLDGCHGQAYTFAVEHGFNLLGEDDDSLVLTVSVAQCFANKKYNVDDGVGTKWGFRDTTVTASLDWAAADHLTISPYIAYSDTIDSHFRDAIEAGYDEAEWDEDVGQLYGGVVVALEF